MLSTVVRIVVLSVVTVSEYPLPLFVPDSLPHYWRRINSGHWQPRCGYKSITTAPFVVSTQSCNGISDNQELLQLSHTTLLLLNIQCIVHRFYNDGMAFGWIFKIFVCFILF